MTTWDWEEYDEPNTLKVGELVEEAMAEDRRNHGRFDEIGFFQFFPEEAPDNVRAAWLKYDELVFGC